MPNETLEQVYNQARALLRDTQVVGGEDYTDVTLAPYFQEAYRRLYQAMMAASAKRVQRTIFANLPALTTILIPATINCFDIFEPILVEERAAGTNIPIVTTSNTIPIIVNCPGHGLSTGTEIIITDVLGTYAPWGLWFVIVIDANNFSLNGSMGDGTAGTGGYATIPNNLAFTEVLPMDLPNQGFDGTPTTSLGVYLWQNQNFMFRGSSEVQQLRITYWASGSPPTNSAAVINIDSSIDFLAYATAFGAAQASGWKELADTLLVQAYGNPQIPSTGLLAEYTAGMTKMLQRGPQRRMLPFRPQRNKWGGTILGSY
jgi:hypothetical protein